MRKGWHAGLVCASIAISVATTGPNAAAQASLTPIRAAYVPAAMWLPAWVAKERGIFTKNGLDVTLTVAQNLGLLPGTAGRQFDFVPSTPPDLIKAVAAGLDVIGVAAAATESEDHPTTQVIVRADSGIAGAKDLTGKLIAVPAIGSVIHVSTLNWLKHNGVDISTVRAVEVPFPNMGDQLKSKRVEAVEAVDPIAGSLRAAGNVAIAAPLLSVQKDVLFAFWIAQGTWARDNQPILKAWKSSLDEALAFIASNPDEARKIMAQYTKLPEPVLQKTPLPTYKTAISPKDLEVWVGVMKDVGQLPLPVDAGKLVIGAY